MHLAFGSKDEIDRIGAEFRCWDNFGNTVLSRPPPLNSALSRQIIAFGLVNGSAR